MRTEKVLVYLPPTHQRRLFAGLSRRHQNRVRFVGAQGFRHLIVPCSDIRSDQIEDTLQRWYEHSGNVICSIQVLVAVGSCY